MLLETSYRSVSRPFVTEESFDSKRGMLAWLPSFCVKFEFDFLTSVGEVISALLTLLTSLILWEGTTGDIIAEGYGYCSLIGLIYFFISSRSIVFRATSRYSSISRQTSREITVVYSLNFSSVNSWLTTSFILYSSCYLASSICSLMNLSTSAPLFF